MFYFCNIHFHSPLFTFILFRIFQSHFSVAILIFFLTSTWTWFVTSNCFFFHLLCFCFTSVISIFIRPCLHLFYFVYSNHIFPWQFLYFFPLPHGQGSLRPTDSFFTYGVFEFFFFSPSPDTAWVSFTTASLSKFSCI